MHTPTPAERRLTNHLLIRRARGRRIAQHLLQLAAGRAEARAQAGAA